jgi:pyridoxal phosphate enzyme (YggS family)
VSPEQNRRAEIAENLHEVRRLIADACADAGRDPAEVTLVAVTKTYPATDVLHLAALGVVDIGENRDQEASVKSAQVAAAGEAVRWHFVGQLQRNKCRSVVGYADLVHSVDGVRLATTLSDAARAHRDRMLDVLVQVSLDGDPERGGAVVGSTDAADADRGFDRVVDVIAASPSLRLRGVMAVVPLRMQPDQAFASLAEVSERLRVGYPTASVISAGMSGDLRDAIANGATHVRIGTALLGNRPQLR